jgi:hypothetical protein
MIENDIDFVVVEKNQKKTPPQTPSKQVPPEKKKKPKEPAHPKAL